MLILDRDGTPLWNGWGGRTDARTKTTIDLPTALALHDSTVIDHLIGAVFDQLHHGVVELRLRPVLLITVTSERADAAPTGQAEIAR
jgi:hypothetical protein